MSISDFILNVFVCFIIYIIINRIHCWYKAGIEELEKSTFAWKANEAHEISCTKSIIKNNLFNYYKAEEIRFGIRGLLVVLDKKRLKFKNLFNDEIYSDSTINEMLQIIKNIDTYHQQIKKKFGNDFKPDIKYISIPEVYDHLRNYSKLAAICVDKIILFQTVANKIVNNSDGAYNDYKK